MKNDITITIHPVSNGHILTFTNRNLNNQPGNEQQMQEISNTLPDAFDRIQKYGAAINEATGAPASTTTTVATPIVTVPAA